MVCHIGVVRANVNRVSFVFAHIFFCVNSMDTLHVLESVNQQLVDDFLP